MPEIAEKRKFFCKACNYKHDFMYAASEVIENEIILYFISLECMEYLKITDNDTADI